MLDGYHIPPKIIFKRIVSENRSYVATVTGYTHCRGNASLTHCQSTTSQAYLITPQRSRTPTKEKNGANFGEYSLSAMMGQGVEERKLKKIKNKAQNVES